MKPENLDWFRIVVPFCYLPIFVFFARYNRILRANAVALACDSMLKVPRPRVKRWEAAQFYLMWSIVFGYGAISHLLGGILETHSDPRRLERCELVPSCA